MAVSSIRSLVEALCSNELAGRRTGTEGGRRAARFVADALLEAGLQPSAPDGSFFQSIGSTWGQNVLGRIPGSGPLADRAVLIGAHFDHLGVIAGRTHPGADDNAAAVAALIRSAGILVERRSELGREIRICAFDAEEPPSFLGEAMGSIHYVRSRAFPIERIDLMICLDLVGHALGQKGLPEAARRSVFVLGAEHTPGLADLVDRVDVDGIRLRRMGANVIPSMSDYHAFRIERVPFLFFSAGRWEHYHTPADTPEKLDYAKITALSDALVAVAIDASTQPPAPSRYDPSAESHEVSLGTLRELSRLLEGQLPAARSILTSADALLDKLARGDRLSKVEVGMISYLVLRLEESLAGT